MQQVFEREWSARNDNGGRDDVGVLVFQKPEDGTYWLWSYYGGTTSCPDGSDLVQLDGAPDLERGAKVKTKLWAPNPGAERYQRELAQEFFGVGFVEGTYRDYAPYPD